MKFTMTLPADAPAKTVKELLEEDWLVPRKVRHFIRTRKGLLVNGQPRHFQELVQGNDQITVILEATDYPVRQILSGDPRQIAVLYEDEHLIIVNKPAGMKTHPNQPDEKDTLLNHLAAYLAPSAEPHVVHRLDKETSGAILFAKNPFVLPILGRMLEQKTIFRRYQAVVHGELNTDHTITKKIGRDRHDRRKRRIDQKHGKAAVTHVTVAKHLGKSTAVFCRLETGRTHQIRVHLASIGHPLAGDPLYSQKASGRLMLHAFELQLVHPFTKETIQVIAQPSLW
ncbi:pseudouridine synthase [Enterococcus florum]|uniref:Pseudouridine synthase n=1 Tax=Enterococcus florum TaxID=2480627 RepID=A0A4P5PAA0_9ENTE|nr:RluA family pseudouridine synthase [Enterococcus florum]GCF93161.1 pseudouridine synthase [Enterococcus florum]